MAKYKNVSKFGQINHRSVCPALESGFQSANLSDPHERIVLQKCRSATLCTANKEYVSPNTCLTRLL